LLQFVGKRILASIPVLVGVTILLFLVLHLIPGDPAQILLFGSHPSPQQLQQLRERLGLNQPLPEQYLHYLGHLLHGNLGRSFQSNSTISSEISARFPSTLRLTVAGMAVAVAVGLPLGVLAGSRPGTILDRVGTGVAVLGIAVPYFWLALILVLVFAVHLNWLPALGVGPSKAIILPAVSLGIAFAAAIARVIRGSLIEALQQPYILVARAKGLSERMIVFRHALKNAFISVVTILGLQFGAMISGAAVIEVIYARPGLGSYLVSAIQAKDIPAVQGTVLFIAVIYLVINICVDIAYGILDPRIREGWGRA
jgi:peptide/nickel transport system permease protein